MSTFLDSAGLGVLVGGLVSNAVVHANGPSLSLTVDEPITNVLHVAVRDASQVIPQRSPQPPDVHATGGRGLFMVDALSTRWGSELNLPGFSAGSVVPTANAGGPLGA